MNLIFTKELHDAREKALRDAADNYYNATPTLTDSAYDALWALHQTERAYCPEWFESGTILDQVGAPPSSGFNKVAHAVPMLSLDNVFEDEQDGCPGLNAWLEDVANSCGPQTEVLVEPKIDGLSLRLRYVGGMLMQAVTRGTGTEGEDVSANVATASMVPKQLKTPIDLEVNGEVFMGFKEFEALNARMADAGEALYANPRNAASGSLRLHDPSKSAARGLRFIPHGIAQGGFDSHNRDLTYLMDCGFDCLAEVGIMASDVVASVSDFRQRVAADLDYPIDGLVFKVDSAELRARLGTTSRAPRWAVALKFQQERVTTKLVAITVQVGRGGALTPVAELAPVWVDGSTVSRATLHNEDQINRLGLLVGDTVEIQKMGAIVPGITKSITAEERRSSAVDVCKPFSLLEHIGGKCPSCGGTDIRRPAAGGTTIPGRFAPARPSPGVTDDADMLIVDVPRDEPFSVPPETIDALKEAVAYRCMNPSCPAQLAGRIQHFCSRKALDIDGIGEEAAGALAELLPQHTAPRTPNLLDLLDLSTTLLAGLRWTTASGGTMTFGESRAKKAYAAFQRAADLPLHRWLFALGIPSIGENTSKEISRLCKNPEDVTWNAEFCEISFIANGQPKDGDNLRKYQISSHLGPVSCNALRDYCLDPETRKIMFRIFDMGVVSDNYNPIPVKVETGSMLSGKTVVITGTLSVSRDEMKVLLEQAGAKVGNSISAKTDFLVVGDKAGSKADKAAKLGVNVLTEAAARALL